MRRIADSIVENCTVPRDGSWAIVCEGLHRLARRFGEVVTIVAYLSSWDGELPRPDKLQWQALRKYGVEIKCVKRSGQKEDADRAIISKTRNTRSKTTVH
jgi:hypothetical protein